jgi:hypothetical protein
MHACVRDRLRDRQHIRAYTSSQTKAWRIVCPELALLSGSINLEYFYTEIRFSTPGSAPTCQLVYGVDHAGSHPRTHACTQQLLLLKRF